MTATQNYNHLKDLNDQTSNVSSFSHFYYFFTILLNFSLISQWKKIIFIAVFKNLFNVVSILNNKVNYLKDFFCFIIINYFLKANYHKQFEDTKGQMIGTDITPEMIISKDLKPFISKQAYEEEAKVNMAHAKVGPGKKRWEQLINWKTRWKKIEFLINFW